MTAALHGDLQTALTGVREARAFNAEKWVEEKCQLFNKYMADSGLKACCINVSGGVDSAVTLGLCVRASKMEGSPIQKIVGVCQPIHSTESIWKRGLEVISSFGCDGITIDSTDIFDQLSKRTEDALAEKGVKPTSADKQGFARGQLKSYMRTPPAFYVSQCLSGSGLPCIVMGTGNKDEDGYLAYFCKAGDGVCDVQLINDIHKNEVFLVGKAVGVPENVLQAPPSADLWEGQTDENELGFTYDFVELWTTYLTWPEEKQQEFTGKLAAEAKAQFEDLGAKASKVHNANKHKLNFPHNINIY